MRLKIGIFSFTGQVLDSIQCVATHNNIAVLLANGNLILRLALPPHAPCPSITSAFSIDPNMEDYSDEALPQFVAGVTAIHCCWPLVFVLTEDGIVCIHVKHSMHIPLVLSF